jgi:hypothetical protein
MLLWRYVQLLVGFCAGVIVAFGQSAKNDTVLFTGCNKPTLLASHPLGQFIGRINHNFNTAPVQRTSVSFGLNNANIWQPEVKAYLPHDAQATTFLSTFPWHQRDSVFQNMPRNYDSTVFSADGVMRTFNINVRFKVTAHSDLEITGRGMWLTGGQQPTALITSDGFIEDFHSNIKGGEDPFARKQYTYNQADIFYQDREGKNLHLKKGQFIVPGVQFNYYVYANNKWLNRHAVQASAGVHLGINLPAFSRSVDAGVSGVLQKQFNSGHKHLFTIATAGSLLRQQVWTSSNHVDFSRSKVLPALECMFEYRKALSPIRYWAIGLNFNYLAPYHPSKEVDAVTPVGNRLSSHWHLALTHMYRNSQYWSLVYTYARKCVWSVYALQDFKVNNGPDFQTGIAVQMPFALLR